jgi:hypothetical protein
VKRSPSLFLIPGLNTGYSSMVDMIEGTAISSYREHLLARVQMPSGYAIRISAVQREWRTDRTKPTRSVHSARSRIYCADE